jgi:hypothetical protein
MRRRGVVTWRYSVTVKVQREVRTRRRLNATMRAMSKKSGMRRRRAPPSVARNHHLVEIRWLRAAT